MAETLSSEQLDIVDSRDRVIGTLSRGEVHRQCLMHRSVHVLVFDDNDSILLQKRSMLKDECQGMWDSSCAGHVEAGQTYEDTAPRELEEELGFVAAGPLVSLFKMSATKDNGWEFAKIFRTDYNGPFNVAADEIDEIRWFAPDVIDQWVNGVAPGVPSGELTSGFCEIWTRYRAASSL